jgi:beta-galactosidase
MTERYWEALEPGAGRRAPRADTVTDARTMSLNGTWRFRLAPTSAGTGPAFVERDFDDSAWDELRVPSHWVLEEITPLAGGPARSLRGTAEGPLYTNTALPVPLDPPRMPTENPTGDHRLVFTVPDDWGDAVLRFQGVDSCAKAWLNGEVLGWSTGSRLPFEFDAPVVPGENVLAVRVHRWSSGTYLEDQDMWWLPGIFRDVDLIERPVGAIDDHTVHAGYDHETGLGTLRVVASAPAVVEIPELGIRVAAGETATVAVEPWSAESPRLYRGTLTAAGAETIDLAIGFRTVEIVDGVLRVNGSRVFFRGVNRHEHHPDTGRTLDRETMLRDILLMKQHNVNAVRTSHYPPHPEFLRLCDEFGLWVVEECDLETHGFIYAGWEGNPPADPAWLPAMLDRTARMVERDKNRPSVVVWSMANESWVGENFDALEAWIREHDPSRPIHYERDPSYRNSDFASLMYPSQELLEQIGRREDPRPDGVTDEEDARRRTLPFLLCEYAHAMGNGPGSLGDYHRILRAHERFCGGFVWEWIDHGFTHADAAGRSFIMHGTDVASRPNGGRYCLDGLVLSDRTPKPALAEFAQAVAPVELRVGADGIVVRNGYDHVGLEHLVFTWRLEVDGVERDRGELDVPPLAPGESATLPPPVAAGDEPGEWWLTVEAALAEGTPWAPAGHVVAWAQGLVGGRPWVVVGSDAAAVGSGHVLDATAAPVRDGAEIVLGPATFDAASGRLIRLGGLELDGPRLDVNRAPIENDRGQGGLNDLAGVWLATGIDRMLDRSDAVELDGSHLRVVGRLAAATHPHAISYAFEWSADGDGVVLAASVDFTGPWADTPYRHRDIALPRLGLRLGLPGGYSSASWFGRGPSESYVDSTDAAAIGRWTSTIDDLQVDYPVPQENGNHVDTRRLELSGDGLPTLLVDGDPVFDFTARRWTTEDLERARHPHDLVDSGRVWLNVDHRQLGLGSASVGPAIPERYRIPREATSWRVRFSVR